MCVYIYIYIYREREQVYVLHISTHFIVYQEGADALHVEVVADQDLVREMAGAPRNLAPRNHRLVWIVKPSGCHCTDGHLTSRVFTED